MKLSESDLSFAWQCPSCGCYFPHIPKVLDDDVKRCSKCVEVEILEQRVEGLPGVKISDGDVWLIFPNTMISIEGICRYGAPGPIVKRNLRAWRDKALAEEEA